MEWFRKGAAHAPLYQWNALMRGFVSFFFFPLDMCATFCKNRKTNITTSLPPPLIPQKFTASWCLRLLIYILIGTFWKTGVDCNIHYSTGTFFFFSLRLFLRKQTLAICDESHGWWVWVHDIFHVQYIKSGNKTRQPQLPSRVGSVSSKSTKSTLIKQNKQTGKKKQKRVESTTQRGNLQNCQLSRWSMQVWISIWSTDGHRLTLSVFFFFVRLGVTCIRAAGSCGLYWGACLRFGWRLPQVSM